MQKIGVAFDFHKMWAMRLPITGHFSALLVITPPLGRVLSRKLMKYASEENGGRSWRNVYLVKKGPKSLGDGRHDI